MADKIHKAKPMLSRFLTVLVLTAISAGCTMIAIDYTKLYGPSAPRNRILSTEELKQHKYISFANDVRPILNQRCAVCHSCNDAPCQLNFTSIEGIDRGRSKVPVYNGARFTTQEPTRLDIDASTTAQWRGKGFTPVLNERTQNPQFNLENSLLYKALTTKRQHHFATQGRLDKSYGVGTKLVDDESFVHKQSCPTIESYAKFTTKNPQWGMPFVLPPVTDSEFKTIETWLKQGARVEPEKEISNKLKTEIAKWEIFLNGHSKKEQLVSRYIYEHLFLGHLYFEDISRNDYFMLVRSKTPRGQPIEIIAATRPYHSPGPGKFYYRLARYNRTIVDKTHLPYALSDKRMRRYKQLFLKPDYDVRELPSYEPAMAANPFKTFAAIPAKNRYQFLLDEAQYFVAGFIKGPVCRGTVALSVIDDHFWVVFMDPDESFISQDAEFLARVSENLKLPSEKENHARLWSVWATYGDSAKTYIKEKILYLDKNLPGHTGFGMEQIWDGDHVNDNAALTVYRHYDSATVLKGFVGEVPKTGWVIDYPVLERIHYLLVAGFNVYGKVGHQLSTRLYMDFLRMEAEMEFLAFLPPKDRLRIHRHWYRGTDRTDKLVRALHKLRGVPRENKIEFKTEDVKKEFFVKLTRHMQKAQSNRGDFINRCREFPAECDLRGLSKDAVRIQKALQQISDIGGARTNVFSDTTFLRIKVDGSLKNDLVYTIVRNKSFLNTTSLTESKKMRVLSEDTIDIVPGFVGAYPNFFMVIPVTKIDDFVAEYQKVDGREKYFALVEKYGIRRTNPEFWKISDWFYEKHLRDNTIAAGLFDLNRYKNR